jgi:hypothetical protein
MPPALALTGLAVAAPPRPANAAPKKLRLRIRILSAECSSLPPCGKPAGCGSSGLIAARPIS